MINNTTYATRATAVRGAKRKGIDNFEIVTRDDGRFELRDKSRPLYDASRRERSTCDGPVALVWDLCIEFGARLSRRDVVAKAVDMGVNINTARTQYNKWRNTSK